MNCMKHRKKHEKGCSAAARKLIQEAFTELQADAIVNGWGTALGNLHRKTEALHVDNYMNNELHEDKDTGLFINDTVVDPAICPYCGSTETERLSKEDSIERGLCHNCKKESTIVYDSDKVSDVLDTDGESLLLTI